MRLPSFLVWTFLFRLFPTTLFFSIFVGGTTIFLPSLALLSATASRSPGFLETTTSWWCCHLEWHSSSSAFALILDGRSFLGPSRWIPCCASLGFLVKRDILLFSVDARRLLVCKLVDLDLYFWFFRAVSSWSESDLNAACFNLGFQSLFAEHSLPSELLTHV